MEKLSTFQYHNSIKLYHLAKKLNEEKFFDTFLNENQLKLISYIITQCNYEIWCHFLDGNCSISYLKDKDVEIEDLVEDGAESIKKLALHIRYLLWEKAIDYYYDSKELSESLNNIEEVSHDFQLIDELDALQDEDQKNESAKTEVIKSTKIREEEDDYDDDDEEEDQDMEKNDSKDGNEENENKELKFNDNKQLILEIPLSTFYVEVLEDQQSIIESEESKNLNELQDQESILKEFNKVYHNFEYDKETLSKRRKLEKSDQKLEETERKEEKSDNQHSGNMNISFGPASTSLQHLLNRIQLKRDDIPLNEFELRSLFMDVRKNRGKWANDERIGQEELYEACEKTVLELRGYTEHSTPFLNKVSKREAPNYGLIIKKPMDLNTVMKKLKSLSYDSKQSFVDDLMLIWSNCLLYNADPKHFLRAHAIAMQKITLKLIPQIPNITIRSRSEVEKEEELLESETKTGTPFTGKSTHMGKKRTREDEIKSETENTPDLSEASNPVSDIQPEVKKNEIIQTEQAEEEEEEEEEDNDNNNSDMELEDEFDPELQKWRTITAKSRADYCSRRALLFDEENRLRLDAPAIIRNSSEMSNFKRYLNNSEMISKSTNLLENDEPYLLEYDITGGIPGITYSGIDEEEDNKREQKLADLYLREPEHKNSALVISPDSGLNKIYYDNISEIQEIRKICFKISLIRQMQTQLFVHHTQMKQPEIDSIKEVDVDPVSKLSNHDLFTYDVQYSVLRRNIGKIAMQTGFESVEPAAINTLTQVAETYIGNLIKSIKLHSETTSSNKMSQREILLASLLENGIEKPDDLYTFVNERILKQQSKLKDLRVKLANFLKELLRPGLENFNERSFEDNSEQFMTGDFSNDLGDDFFGFKELGLDKEFKLLSSSIPIYLLHSRLHTSYSSNGSVNKNNKFEDLKDFGANELKASEIDKQIGLLKPFYTRLYEKSKAIFIKNQKKKGESTELPENNQLPLIEDDELPQKQRNIRPRLPPTGKISSVKKKLISNSFFLPDEEEPTDTKNILKEEAPDKNGVLV